MCFYSTDAEPNGNLERKCDGIHPSKALLKAGGWGGGGLLCEQATDGKV